MSTVVPDLGSRAAERRGAVGSDPARLEVVHQRAPRARGRRVLSLVSAATVAASVLAVVLGHAYVAQEQVRLASTEAAVAAAQVRHHQEMVSVAHLENPSRIFRRAEATLHVATTGHVSQVPYVTLDVPLPAPSLAPGPAAPTSSG